MDIFGVGPSELVFILLIAIIILGPKDMQKAGRTIGRFLNQLVRSDGWKIFQRTSTEIRNLPRNLMREANMELQDVDKQIRQSIDPRSHPLTSGATPSVEPEADQPPSNEAASAPQGESPTAQPTEDNADKNE
jgi:sec-independent protein translocase protein TatB